MRGPNSAAGVKILVHDQEEIPLVRSLGQAISPGSHAFVGIQMLQVKDNGWIFKLLPNPLEYYI